MNSERYHSKFVFSGTHQPQHKVIIVHGIERAGFYIALAICYVATLHYLFEWISK